TLQPLNTALDHVGRNGDVVVARGQQSVDDHGGGVGVGFLAPAAEPTPATVAALHVAEPLDAFAHHVVDNAGVPDRLTLPSFPLLGALLRIADLLRIEVGAFLADGLEV